MTLTDTPPQAPPITPTRKRRRFPRFVRVLLLVAIAAGLAALHVRAARPVVLARAGGLVRQMRATPEGVYWIEDASAAGSSRLLFLSRVGGQPQALAQGQALVAFALHEQHLLVLDAGAAAPSVHSPHPDGRLLRVPRTGGREDVVAGGLRDPAGLWVDANGIYWTETYPPDAPAVPFVPALGHISLLRMLPGSGGTPRLVARLESTGPQFEGQLMGRCEDDFLWLEPRHGRSELGVTLLRSIPMAAGTPVTRWTTDGASSGALASEAIYATDVSTEASPASMYVSVHRYPSRAGHAERQGGAAAAGDRVLLTDWLYTRGWLLAHEGTVYYVGNRLWRVPSSIDWPEPVTGVLENPAAADIGGGFLYCTRPEPREQGRPGAPGAPPPAATQQLVRWPLTSGARLRGLVGRW